MPTADSCTEPAAVICCSFLFGAASYFETAPSGLLKNYFSNEKVLNSVLTIDINVVFDDRLF